MRGRRRLHSPTMRTLRSHAIVVRQYRTVRGPPRGGRSGMTLEGLSIFLVIGAAAGWLAGQIMKGGGFGLVGICT